MSRKNCAKDIAPPQADLLLRELYFDGLTPIDAADNFTAYNEALQWTNSILVLRLAF